jgi:PilZ domain
MASSRDRRQFLRAGVKWPATIIPSGLPTPAEIKSISQTGASICCQQLPPAGQEFRLEIQPPNRQSIIVTARPIWAIETGSSEISSRFVFGVQFEYISEEDIRFLGDIVAKQKSFREKDEACAVEHDERP